MQGWSRIFGTQGLVEFAKSLFKLVSVTVVVAFVLRTSEARAFEAMYTDPVALTHSWRIAMWVCAALCVAGGFLALGIRNDVLAAEPAPDTIDEAPHPGECFHCGVEGPPTHVVPVHKVEAA